MSNIHRMYRGKRKSDNKWVYGSLLVEFDGSHRISYWLTELIEPENNYSEPVNYVDDVEPMTVGKWTGLKDINGKDIYEGDVIERPNKVWGVIVWNAPYFEVTVSETQSSLYTREWIQECKVIGNTHTPIS